jgi:signal peptidase II
VSQALPERERRPQPDVRVGSATNALQPVVALAALAADQLTKWVVSGELSVGGAVDVLGPFRIHHVRNSGIAFGLFSDATGIVIVLTAIAVTAMLVYFARSGLRHPVLPVALGLVLGGSVSNLFDRLRLGYVTDFLDLAYWPAFNLADTFIVLGVVLLFASFVAADRASARVGSVPLSRL